MPLSLNLPKDMEKRIKEIAEENMTSKTSIIKLSVKQFLEQNETKTKK